MANFLGEYCYVLDDKGRVKLPSKIRRGVSDAACDTFVVTRGMDGCLNAYPKDEWARYAGQLRNLPRNLETNRRYVRKILQGAEEVVVDKQGRMTLPQSLLQEAGIGRDVMICGALDYLEIWEPKKYDEYINDPDLKLEEAAENVLYGNAGQPAKEQGR